MASAGIDSDEQPIGELFGRLIDEGKGYARAEIGLVRVTAEAKAEAFKLPALLLVGALLFVIAGVVVLCMTIALVLATLIGPLAGGLAATVIAFGIAGALGLIAKSRLGAGR
ncbi:MAG: phage holin family protein [Sphingomonas bacterium]|nr:phage holin family protein [Sphingomonas bacterium]